MYIHITSANKIVCCNPNIHSLVIYIADRFREMLQIILRTECPTILTNTGTEGNEEVVESETDFCTTNDSTCVTPGSVNNSEQMIHINETNQKKRQCWQ